MSGHPAAAANAAVSAELARDDVPAGLDADATATITLVGAHDVPTTLASLSRGVGGGPTFRSVEGGLVWLTARTPDGPGTLAIRQQIGAADAAGDSVVSAWAWGAGAGWLVDGLPDLVGAHDDVAGFEPTHPVLAEAWRRYPGLRVPRTRLVWDALVPAVLEQKVTSTEAWRSWRELVWRFGEPAPGPAPRGMRVVPTPQTVLALPTWEWHRAGVDMPRRRALRAAATVAGRLAEAVELPRDKALARLRVVPGIGPWTAAEVAQRAFGDADAVSVGDYHIPSLVGWSLLGERLDDAGMLRVLEEYRPHRHRVVRLLELGGSRPPRRGPRAPVRDYRGF